jgi:DNA-binding response OmpR family regulator
VLLRSAFSGASAIELARSIRLNLILLDVDMPGMNGFEVFRQLRNRSLTLNISVIFLTAMTDTLSTAGPLSLQKTDYIIKPFDAAVLISGVYEVIHNNSYLNLINTVDQMGRTV